MDPILKLENVSVSYDDVPILHDVSLEVFPGEIVGVVGESGSGKSTTINAVMGLLGSDGAVTEGSVTFEGQELLSLGKEDLRELRGTGISLIAQDPTEVFHPIRKIRDQLKEYVKCHDGLTYGEAEERLLQIMEKINLPDGKRILNSYSYELSGGMCQRVAIAFAMLYEPKLLFADEPTSALDVTVQAQVVEELKKINRDSGTAIFIVSHNMGVVSHMASRVIIMYSGIIVEQGPTEAILRDPRHPYTRNLIKAIPKMNEPAPTGVQNYTRDRSFVRCLLSHECACRTERCEKAMPPLVEVSPGHLVRCCEPNVIHSGRTIRRVTARVAERSPHE